VDADRAARLARVVELMGRDEPEPDPIVTSVRSRTIAPTAASAPKSSMADRRSRPAARSNSSPSPRLAASWAAA
jgi:hypothetical protein